MPLDTLRMAAEHLDTALDNLESAHTYLRAARVKDPDGPLKDGVPSTLVMFRSGFLEAERAVRQTRDYVQALLSDQEMDHVAVDG